MNEHQASRLVWLLVIAYALFFAWVSLAQNDALQTNASDLGNMGQAAWTTLHNGIPLDTSTGRPVTRFAGHVEPIFYLLALAAVAGDPVRNLLVLQAVAVALGARAAYGLARRWLNNPWAGVTFAALYLLFPALEAATLTEFHPVTLAAPLWLTALDYLHRQRTAPFLLFTFLAVATKEDMSLIALMIGLYLVVVRRQWRLGAGVMIASLAWFYLTLYVIIPACNPAGNVLFDRYRDLGGSPTAVLVRLITDPVTVVKLATDPARIAYLIGLLAPVGFMALFSPFTLALAGGSFAINLLSNYPTMYSGVSHYSAPIVPFVIAAAIEGTAWLHQKLLEIGKPRSSAWRLPLLLLGVLLIAGVYHRVAGFTPVGSRLQRPVITPHARLLPRFTAQVPANAVVSAQPALYPHLATRAAIYEFPAVQDAEFILLDVTSRVAMHPNDFRRRVDQLLSTDFVLVDAADGYILLKRGAPTSASLPPAFYTFVNVQSPQPQYPAHLIFSKNDAELHFLGFDLFEPIEEGRRLTGVRTYWQTTRPLPPGLRLWPYWTDDAGQVIEEPTLRPLVGTLWAPPERWTPGQTVMISTLPWEVERHGRAELRLAVFTGDDPHDPDRRLLPQPVTATLPLRPVDGSSPETVVIGVFARSGDRLLPQLPVGAALPPGAVALPPASATFGDQLRLVGYLPPRETTVRPGQVVSFTLYWQGMVSLPVDYTTFNHLVKANDPGRLAGQQDGPTGGPDYPTRWWTPGVIMPDIHPIQVRDDALSGDYRLTVGLYRLDDMTRLRLRDGGDALPLFSVKVVP